MQAGTFEPVEGEADERRFRIALAAILLVALALRIAVRAASGPHDFFVNSYGFYLAPAQALAEGQGYVDEMGAPLTERPPLYALFVAALSGYRAFWPILIAQALISTATVALAASITRCLANRSTALIAAAITACYPYFIRHDTALQESGLFTCLTALAMLLLLALRDRRAAWLALAAGTGFGLALLTRPTLLPMLPLAAGWLLLSDARGTDRARRVRSAAWMLAAAALTLSPWVIRQHAVLGRWALTSDVGRALFVGNNPDTFAVYPAGSIDRSQEIAFAHVEGEAAPLFGPRADPRGTAFADWLRARALNYIREHPGRFLVAAVRKNMAAFGPWPSPRHGTLENLVHALSYGPILVLALVGLWRDRRQWRVHLLFYAQFAVFVASTGLFWAHTSHRAFLDVYLIVFAAIALSPLVARFMGTPSRRYDPEGGRSEGR